MYAYHIRIYVVTPTYPSRWTNRHMYIRMYKVCIHTYIPWRKTNTATSCLSFMRWDLSCFTVGVSTLWESRPSTLLIIWTTKWSGMEEFGHSRRRTSTPCCRKRQRSIALYVLQSNFVTEHDHTVFYYMDSVIAQSQVIPTLLTHNMYLEDDPARLKCTECCCNKVSVTNCGGMR